MHRKLCTAAVGWQLSFSGALISGHSTCRGCVLCGSLQQPAQNRQSPLTTYVRQFFQFFRPTESKNMLIIST